MPRVLQNAWDSYRNGDYQAINNQWGVPSALLNQPGSRAWIDISDEAAVPGGITMHWTYPAYHPPSWVWSYMEVMWGGGYGAPDPALTTTLGNLKNFEVSYSVQAGSPDSNVLIEFWTRNAAGQISKEVGVFVYGWGNNSTQLWTDGNITAYEQLNNPAGSTNWQFITYRTTTDLTTGTIDLANIVRDLIRRGILDPNETVSGVEIGAEVGQGSGQLRIDRFEVYQALEQTRTIVRNGTGDGETFDISTNNPYVIDGAGGVDVVRIAAPYADTQVTLKADGHVGLSHARYGVIDLADVEQIRFADFALQTASLFADRTGADLLSAASGSTVLLAGDGADTLMGWSGSAYLRGGAGDDQIEGGSAFDDIHGNMGDDLARGGGGNDWVVGGQGHDSLSGEAGEDLVLGNLGEDTCDGGDGADTIRGGQANDLLTGGAGADWLSGDRGDDTLTGGAGADIFHSFAAAGLDRVADFSAAEGDRVQLDPGTAYAIRLEGADTVIDMGAEGRLVLVGVDLTGAKSGWIFLA